MTEAIDDKPAAQRADEDAWLDAAHSLLVEQGVDAVRILPLAKMLGVSRTSFYWRFADREALLEALIDRWRRKNTDNLIAQAERYADNICEAVFNIFDCWIDDTLFDARLDFAIRNWAQGAPELKSVLVEADAARIAALTAMFERFGYASEEASIRGHTVYYTQTGYIAMLVDEPIVGRLARMPLYVEIYTGARPSAGDIARFIDRHAHRRDAA